MTGIDTLKEKYKEQLRPFFELLLERRNDVSKSTWDDSVRKLEESVIKTPEQYLSDIPRKNPEILRLVVNDIFSDLIAMP